ncbi:MAG TPA: DinB family protein [Gemmatimonadaceae bacterium]|nr:DinB family protein [Gemmatimonadaceae bacterium]
MREHGAVVHQCVLALQAIDSRDWWRVPSPGTWSPATVALHLCVSYELGRDVATGGQGMRLRSSRPFAWLLRSFLLPYMLATKRFPRGVRAPREVRPDEAEASRLTCEAACERLTRAAHAAADVLRDLGRHRSEVRFTHAYFGPLTPLTTLRLLSAHTRHHVRRLA